jgi:UDP-N-acetylglucosamine--N-acetylmuramyl-(pentapeptide) pyrophosphoryl-undecaprenol N-acetylglucosamine transferase
MYQSNIKNTQPNSQNCFYICGLTGGPYFPIPAIIEQINNFDNVCPILIGVRSSYEQKLAESQNLKIQYLPKVKLDLLSFRNAKLYEILIDFFKMVFNIFGFGYSILKCMFLLLKFRPVLIYSTGSFLAVPMIWSSFFLNKVHLTNTKIVVHQQDATVGLANKLTVNFADLTSCVFDYSRNNYKQFETAHLIPNPIIPSKYYMESNWEDEELETFVKNNKEHKPLLLIFGGGSGSLFINNWVADNVDELLAKFRVIHLTGTLQKESNQVQNLGFSHSKNLDYHSQIAVIEDMPVLLASVDLVMCRAGLGSISELIFLNKKTFLVPLPDSHQEQNAILTVDNYSNFEVLEQAQSAQWLDQILNYDLESKTTNNDFDKAALDNYYTKLIELIS